MPDQSPDDASSNPRARHVDDIIPERLVGRSASRGAAIQALYESDLSNRRVERCLGWIATEQKLSSKQSEFARALAIEVEVNRDRIDRVLNRYALGWQMDSASPIARNVLRVALAERNLYPETSDAVVISEAVKLVKLFDTDGAGRFVNGILGAMVRDGRFGQ